MSVFEDGSYGSLPGIALIGKVLAGRCGMRYTRAAVGSGTIPEGMTPKTMTDSAGYVMDARIASISNPVDGECQVTVQIKSDDVATGFYLTNIVLFAEDPDLGEVPYTYLSLENEPEWIRPASSIVGKLATFDIIAAVGDVDKVVAVIDPEAIATVGHVEQAIAEHNADEDAHKEVIQSAAEQAMADAFAGGTAKQEIVVIIQEMIAAGEISTGGGIVKTVEAELTPEGWQSDPNMVNGYIYFHDIEDAEVTAELMPMLVIDESSRKAATDCDISLNADTLEGRIRVKAVAKPDANIKLVCYLFGEGSGGGGGGGVYTLPIATATRLGGVKIGEGVDVTKDGTLSVDGVSIVEEVAETDDNATEMLDEVFGENI